jgi:hypothetical protein
MVSLKNGDDQGASLATDFKQSKKQTHTHSQRHPFGWFVGGALTLLKRFKLFSPNKCQKIQLSVSEVRVFFLSLRQTSWFDESLGLTHDPSVYPR